MASNKLKQIIIDAKEIRKEVERRAQRTILAENSGKLDSLIRKLLSEGEEEQSLKPGDDDSFAPDEPAVPTDNVPTNARNIENGTEPVNPSGEADESGQISDIADLLNGLDAEEHLPIEAFESVDFDSVDFKTSASFFLLILGQMQLLNYW